MEMGIAGRRACVTGASKGIGLAIARALAAEGVDVALVARSGDLLEAAVAEIRAGSGVRAAAVVADLAGPAGVEAASHAATAALGGIDILINNAGAIPTGSLDAVSDDVVHDAWELKLHGYIRFSRALLPAMRERGWGRVVNIIGNAGRQPMPGYLYGSTANAALMAFTKALALEASADGVLVNAINPGPIATERFESQTRRRAAASGRSEAEISARTAQAVPLGRVGRPEEVADVAVFLCSERCSYIQGAVIPVEGGVTAAP